MKKTHIIQLLIIALLTLTPVMSAQAQTARTLPKWRDVTRWLKEGNWFYYEITITSKNLKTNMTSKSFVQINYTIMEIQNGIIKMERHYRRKSLTTGAVEEHITELIFNTTDPKLIPEPPPFFIPTNVTNGYTPIMMRGVKMNYTIYIKRTQIDREKKMLIVDYLSNYEVTFICDPDFIYIFNASVHVESSIFRSGLVTEFKTNITHISIRNPNANTTICSIGQNYTSYSVGELKATNVALEETSLVSTQGTDYLFVVILIIIVAIVIVMVRRRVTK